MVYETALQRLAQLQEKDGGFASETSQQQVPFQADTIRHTTFFTATILNCLAELPRSRMRDNLQKKGANFLLSERSSTWSWNYWSGRGKTEEMRLYPDDLDDTFLALSALWGYKKELVTAEALVACTKLLISLEVSAGGPYRTWLVPSSAAATWQDTDIAVNANVAFFLVRQEVRPLGLLNFLYEAVASGDALSRYYPSKILSYYYLSRCSLGPNINAQIAKEILLLHHPEAQWGNALLTAAALSTLSRCGIEGKVIKQGRKYLLTAQQNHQWKAESFCLDPAEKGETRYAGAEAVTIAFCLEALYLTNPTSLVEDAYLLTGRAEILKTIGERTADLDPSLKEILLKVGGKISGLDTQIPILTLPHMVERALGKKSTASLLNQLGMANLYGWIAYSIFDDFLDGEGNPLALPAAIWALREMRYLFAHNIPNESFQKYIQTVLDNLDSANTWEQREARFIGLVLPKKLPRYGNYNHLAARSFGHALPALAVLTFQGIDIESVDGKALIQFFHHFLIARQLNDDAHDWEVDLLSGQLTAVVCMLLQALKKFFWEDTIEHVIQKISYHCSMARKALRQVKVFKEPAHLLKMLEPLEHAVTTVQSERQKTLEFIDVYKKSPSKLDGEKE